MQPQSIIPPGLCHCGCGERTRIIYGRPRLFVQYHHHRLPRTCGAPIAERLWAQVLKTDGCWLWQGGHYSNGYGQISGGGHSHSLFAHRVAWEVTHGPIPAGMFVCHRCDNPPCVRPDHLFLGTPADNMRDMIHKGRARQAKLTVQQVREIRQRWRAGGVTRRQLRDEYGVGKCAIQQLLAGHAWQHVTDEEK